MLIRPLFSRPLLLRPLPPRVWALLLVALCTTASPDCPAQANPDELARRHFESGAAYFEQAEYREALREFNKAYDLSKRPKILLNISIVEERLGNLPKAVEALDEFLARAPEDAETNTVRIRRDNLKKRLEEQQAVLAPPVVEPEPEEPEPEEVIEPPAEEASEEAPHEEEVREPVADLNDEQPSRFPAYALLGAGGLAGVGAIITGIMAQNEHDRLESECGTACTPSQVSDGKSLALTSTVLSGVAVVGIGIGIVWLVTSGPSDDASASNNTPFINVSVGPSAGFAEAAWRF